jgi:hypothetical protein
MGALGWFTPPQDGPVQIDRGGSASGVYGAFRAPQPFPPFVCSSFGKLPFGASPKGAPELHRSKKLFLLILNKTYLFLVLQELFFLFRGCVRLTGTAVRGRAGSTDFIPHPPHSVGNPRRGSAGEGPATGVGVALSSACSYPLEPRWNAHRFRQS